MLMFVSLLSVLAAKHPGRGDPIKPTTQHQNNNNNNNLQVELIQD
jgi:hypothetical protein